MTWQPELDEVRRRRDLTERMGGPDKVRRQHEAGRLTVRERLAALLDDGSFDEIGSLAGKAVYDGEGGLAEFTPANLVTGTGRIDGRKVVVGADDFTIRGGAADAAIAGKQVYAEQLANQLRLPLVRLIEGTGGGGSVKTLEQTGHTYVPANPGWDYVVDNLSVVPVVAAGLGPVAGLGAARLCVAHLSVLVEGVAQLFVAGPPVVRGGIGEQVTKEELGGVAVHGRNGAVDLVAASEHEAFGLIRRFLSYLPPSAYQRPPVIPCADPAGRREEMLLSAIPRDRRQPYRIRDILEAVFDAGSVMEVQRYGGSVVTGLARLDGHPVGVVAGDPYVSGGCLTVEGAEAVTRLADLCSTFHLPVVTFTDQPGLNLSGHRTRPPRWPRSGPGSTPCAIRCGPRSGSASRRSSTPARPGRCCATGSMTRTPRSRRARADRRSAPGPEGGQTENERDAAGVDSVMETWEAITSRRNVRSFGDRPIPAADLDQILEAGRRSPSSQNWQPWDFILVTDRERLRELARVWRGAGHVAGAAAAIVVIGPAADNEFHRAQLDLGQATMAMILAAADLGIGSCHAGVADVELARRLLGFPQDRNWAFLISLGYPADRPLTPVKNPLRRPFGEVIHRDHW